MIQKEGQEGLALPVFKRFKILDLFVIIFTLLISVAVFFIGNNSTGDTVEINADGKEFGIFSLYQDRDITVKTENGDITVCIDKGKAFVKYAACKDKECVNSGYISSKGQTIICLPLKVMIKIGGSKYEYTY